MKKIFKTYWSSNSIIIVSNLFKIVFPFRLFYYPKNTLTLEVWRSISISVSVEEQNCELNSIKHLIVDNGCLNSYDVCDCIFLPVTSKMTWHNGSEAQLTNCLYFSWFKIKWPQVKKIFTNCVTNDLTQWFRCSNDAFSPVAVPLQTKIQKENKFQFKQLLTRHARSLAFGSSKGRIAAS